MGVNPDASLLDGVSCRQSCVSSSKSDSRESTCQASQPVDLQWGVSAKQMCNVVACVVASVVVSCCGCLCRLQVHSRLFVSGVFMVAALVQD